MKITSSKFIISAARPGQYPDSSLASIALAGRSNVGKSSFVNSILNKKNLARVSSSPGKTRTINFYLVNEAFYLVDLPGYGYAKASRAEKEKFFEITDSYFKNAENLKSVFILLDIRHEPKESDKIMYDYCLHYNIDARFIATKADKLSKSRALKSAADIKKYFELPPDKMVYSYSAVTKEGAGEILAQMEEILF